MRQKYRISFKIEQNAMENGNRLCNKMCNVNKYLIHQYISQVKIKCYDVLNKFF